MTALAVVPSPLVRGLMLWTLYALPLLVTVRPVAKPLYDPDIWWHLQVGRWVALHQTVTSTDPFSQYGQDRPWVAYSWLYELVVYALHSAWGLAGIVVYRVLVSLLVVWAIHALVCRLEKRFLVSTGLTAVAVLAVASLFSERPWLVTILCSTLTLHAIVALGEEANPPRWIWTLPLVYVVWANVHIQFVYGLGLLGLACLAPLLDRWLGWDRERPPPLATLLLLSLLCFVATFVTPYHARLYLVVVEYATQPGPFRWISELTALGFREASDWVMLALTLAACYALGRRPPSSFHFLLLASTAFFAFRAKRDLWFLVLADLVILASMPARPTLEPPRLSYVGKAVLLAGLWLLVGALALLRDLTPEGLQARVDEQFPVQAAAFVARQGYAGPMYNDFNWGGYLIWALPDLPVAIDGRTNLHGDERIERFGRVWSGLPGWHDDPDLSAANVVVAPVNVALVSLLERDSRFVRVYRDEVACVFRRVQPR